MMVAGLESDLPATPPPQVPAGLSLGRRDLGVQDGEAKVLG